jgi:hypothetical protein
VSRNNDLPKTVRVGVGLDFLGELLKLFEAWDLEFVCYLVLVIWSFFRTSASCLLPPVSFLPSPVSRLLSPVSRRPSFPSCIVHHLSYIKIKIGI